MRTSETRVPPVAGWALKRGRELVEPLLIRVRGEHEDAGHMPPRRLRARTGAPGLAEFVAGGREAAHELALASTSAGAPLHQARGVLDFGCGSGRVLTHVAALAPQARCCGCDVDSVAIAWAARHKPELRWAVSDFVPPLPFASEQFDLVYSISVFSHLHEDLQDRWLEELRRVLAPGGFALLSVHGDHAFRQFRCGAVSTGWCRAGAFDREPLRAGELVFEPYVRSRWNDTDLPGVGPGYGLAFHGRDYVARHWSTVFDVLGVRERAIAGWQDLVMCRRRA
jgi:SAM-dependent methyltransferase